MTYTTRPSLLARVANHEEPSWEEFYRIYAPYIRSIGYRIGIDPGGREDLVQMVMLEVFEKDKANFERQRLGSFRRYLRMMIQNRAKDLIRKLAKNPLVISSEPSDEQLPQDDTLDLQHSTHYEKEWKNFQLNSILAIVKERVEPKTYQAFHLYAMEDMDVNEVANYLEMTAGSVYLAKTRCMDAAREINRKLKREDEDFAL